MELSVQTPTHDAHPGPRLARAAVTTLAAT